MPVVWSNLLYMSHPLDHLLSFDLPVVFDQYLVLVSRLNKDVVEYLGFHRFAVEHSIYLV